MCKTKEKSAFPCGKAAVGSASPLKFPARKIHLLGKEFLGQDGIGIDGKEDVPEILPAKGLVNGIELMLHVADKGRSILRRIHVAVLERTVQQVVRDIVGLPELVSVDDTKVHGMAYPLITVVLVAFGRRLNLL